MPFQGIHPPSGDLPPQEIHPLRGFTLLGDAGTPSDAAAFVGDVQEPSDMGFAAAPTGGEDDMMGFAAAPPVDDNQPILLGAPPADDAPIVLGPPPVETPVEPVVPDKPSAMKKFNEE